MSVVRGKQIFPQCGHQTEHVIAPVTGSAEGFSTALVHPDTM